MQCILNIPRQLETARQRWLVIWVDYLSVFFFGFFFAYPYLDVAYSLLDVLGICMYSILPFLNGSIYKCNPYKQPPRNRSRRLRYTRIMNHVHGP